MSCRFNLSNGYLIGMSSRKPKIGYGVNVGHGFFLVGCFCIFVGDGVGGSSVDDSC